MMVKGGIIHTCMLMDLVICKIIPLSTLILVVGCEYITFQGMMHQYFPELFTFGELPDSPPCGDGIKGKCLDNNGILC